ncbi:polysaccharide deacetylase family protein [Allopontixanthobacter sp.]|uniref:polysaccharide deacetylase family protein n=1 Tax=Allopontixanthobacter sp. TaxID=2906452 RepID=UPI002ABBADF6|nr:polysaccharide deacetylase family protein [Allopontixanthobacter sp.]MDZ4307121.1 polysaccharide deacetylase family protein [Allopontixanthobacter sp.]
MPPSVSDAPGPDRIARFRAGWGQRSLLTVDTEEEFDWNAPFTVNQHGLDHVGRLTKFQQFCEGIGVSPVYLIDWPVAASPVAAEILGDAVKAGRAEIGIQLHPWVNPPHEEEVNSFNSYAGNLPPGLEREKFLRLKEKIEESFQTDPMIYRAGRYGLGPNSAAMLREAGIAIDSSVRSKFDYRAGHGPDYRATPLVPYWLDEPRGVLELPLTTVFWGLMRRQGDLLQPLVDRHPHLGGILSRLSLLERISLTPEGISAEEALRGIDIALDDGLPLLVLSFHSPSLVPGNTPYVRTEEDLDRFYDWWRTIYSYLEKRGIAPTSVAEIIKSVEI